jgi:transcriptional regulator with XRE-family HTH domain
MRFFADARSQTGTGRNLEVLPCGHRQGGPQVHTRRDWLTPMAVFVDEVRRLMAEHGMSLRQLAKASNYDPSYLSKVLGGRKPSSPYLAARLDDALGADGKIRDAAQESPPRRAGQATPAPRKSSGAVEALQVAMTGDPAGPNIGADGLAELVPFYAHALAVAPSADVYGELMSARSFAGTLLGRSSPRQQPDLMVTAGWLSSLLAISAADLGDHAAAVVWCTDTERRGRDAAYPELLGWAALTRSLIAWYQGDPLASAAAAGRGQAHGLPGSVAHVKLAAQEMRCRAMLGDAAGMAQARGRAAAAMAQLGPPNSPASVYSVPRAEDPPYTATSLLLAGRYAEAAQLTRQIIDMAYHPESRAPGDQPTNYARTLLILALAAAGLGELDEAVAAGTAALECGRVVWPTIVLAGKLDQALAGQFPIAAYAADFHARYLEAGIRLALPAPRSQAGRART